MSSDSGSVVSVTGPVEPEDLGITLMHEHIFIDLIGSSHMYTPPRSAPERQIARQPVALENLWYVKKNPLKSKDNGRLESFADAVSELAYFHGAGGNSLVDVTPKGVGGDPERVRAVSLQTGIQIIHGTSYYTVSSHPKHVSDSTEDELAEEFISDITEGIGNSSVRAGIVGEIGLSGDIDQSELKVLRAGARAAIRTGAPMSIHPPGRTSHRDFTYPSSRWALDVLDIIEDVGLASDRVIVSHMDRMPFEFNESSLEYQEELCEQGAYIEYDLWGTEMTYRDKEGVQGWPSDFERARAVEHLIKRGCGSNILFSQDICMKIQQRKYGGFGYAHVLENVVPLLKQQAIDEEQIREIIVDNPKRVMVFEAGRG